jgi:hypothetical protein
MPNQKISELTAIVTVDNSVDVLPIVDISANTTKKVTPNALKTALALDNVNNTSDANKPVSIAQQDALNGKVDENAPITAGTAPKITFDAKGLVTSGDSLDETDLPTGINANKIGTGVVSSTEFGYLDGVTSAIQTQIDSKQGTLVSGTNIKTVNSTSLLGSGDVEVQPTLVSGTNIKTINSTSLLGSGDITISANPSGVSGAIQFSAGSAFASDAANFFWDDTNNRLGVGTNAPTATTHIKGSGSTSATTSLLVQNSAGSNLLRTFDNGVTKLGGLGTFGKLDFGVTPNDSTLAHIQLLSNLILEFKEFNGSGMRFADGFGKFPLFLSDGKASVNKNAIAEASAQFEVVSTTGGFLPPRMTNSQRTSISSPAVGLMVYCTDAVEGLYINKSTGWTLVI